jgi:hypothetical protein
MRTEKLIGVHVSPTSNYLVGFADVTAVEWGEAPGHMAMLDTVRVFVNGQLHSEHTFTQVLGVYFAKPDSSGGQ